MSGPFSQGDRVWTALHGWGMVTGTVDYGFGPSAYMIRFSADPAADSIYVPDWQVFDSEQKPEQKRVDGLDVKRDSIESFVRASGAKLW